MGGVSRLRNEPVLINQFVQCFILLGKCVCQLKIWLGYCIGALPQTSIGALLLYFTGGRSLQTLSVHPVSELWLLYYVVLLQMQHQLTEDRVVSVAGQNAAGLMFESQWGGGSRSDGICKYLSRKR